MGSNYKSKLNVELSILKRMKLKQLVEALEKIKSVEISERKSKTSLEIEHRKHMVKLEEEQKNFIEKHDKKANYVMKRHIDESRTNYLTEINNKKKEM